MNPNSQENPASEGVTDPDSGSPNPGEVIPRNVRPHRRLGRYLVGAGQWIIGSLFSTFLLFSVLVVGWTARAAQREVLKSWWRRSPVRQRNGSFAEFAAEDPATSGHAAWPTWFAGAGPGASSDAGRLRTFLRRRLGGLGRNARLGVQMIFNTWVLTLPGCLLWAVAWFGGWQNSFNKGYEHAWFGPTVFLLGMLLFSAAMGYVPLAQARQASTGDWRRFYDFRLIWRLVRRQWLASLALAVVWAGASGLVLLVKLMPQIAQYIPSLMDRPPAEVVSISQQFFAVMALGLYPLFVGLRLLAARVYAHALRTGYQSGALTEDDLGDAEWHALRRLELLVPAPLPERRWFVRLAAWLATRTGQVAAAAAVFAVWFVFSFLVVVSEFAAITEYGRGWCNQPMIQLPWFDYTPMRARNAVGDSQ